MAASGFSKMAPTCGLAASVALWDIIFIYICLGAAKTKENDGLRARRGAQMSSDELICFVQIDHYFRSISSGHMLRLMPRSGAGVSPKMNMYRLITQFVQTVDQLYMFISDLAPV